MNTFAKSALVLGTVSALALGSVTASEARSGRWVAGAAGFAVGAAIGAAAANAAAYDSGYYDGPAYDSYAYSPAYAEPAVSYAEPEFVRPVQYRDPAFAYTGDPAYRGYRYRPGYEAYGYAPGYGYRGYYRGGGHIETRSVPRHYDPGAGYNSNTVAPWQDWKMQGHDY
jgi:hypothetical protein